MNLNAPQQIRIAAAIIINTNGETLLVRKKGTAFFMQPGGKIDAGETAPIALERELKEELNFACDTAALQPQGQFSAPAANENGFEVVADLFLLHADFEPKPESEIAEVCWVTPERSSELALAPLTRDHVMPIVRQYI